MRKQVHVFYTGRVQGVGFRFTVLDIARELEVSGWVKNLKNGQVEVTAEAEEDRLKEFLQRIKQYFSKYIQDGEISWSEAEEGFKGFNIAA